MEWAQGSRAVLPTAGWMLPVPSLVPAVGAAAPCAGRDRRALSRAWPGCLLSTVLSRPWVLGSGVQPGTPSPLLQSPRSLWVKVQPPRLTHRLSEPGSHPEPEPKPPWPFKCLHEGSSHCKQHCPQQFPGSPVLVVWAFTARPPVYNHLQNGNPGVPVMLSGR